MRFYKIIDKYLLREFFLHLVLGMTIIMIFLMVNTILFNMLKTVVEKQIPTGVFLKIVFYQLPAYAVLALPMASLFSAMITMSRLSADSEIDVMRTSGIGVLRILFPLLVGGIIASAAGWITLQKVVPICNNKSNSIWVKFTLSDVMSQPMANIFFKGKDNKTFYLNSIDPTTKTVSGITILDTQSGTYPKMIMTAPSGSWKGNDITLRNGIIHHLKPNGSVDYEIAFNEMKFNIERHIEEFQNYQKTPQEMTLNELKEKVSLYKKSGLDTKQWETDMHFKTSVPIASFICVLVGVPLSIRTGRSGMMSGILSTLVLVIVYWVLTIVFTMLGYQGVLPPIVAAWAQNATFLSIGLILVARTRR